MNMTLAGRERVGQTEGQSRNDREPRIRMNLDLTWG